MTELEKAHNKRDYKFSQVEQNFLKTGGVFRMESRAFTPPKYRTIETRVGNDFVDISFSEPIRHEDEIPKNYKANPNAEFNLNYKHLSVLLVAICKAAMEKITVEDAVIEGRASVKWMSSGSRIDAMAFCRMSFYELIEAAGLSRNQHTYAAIPLILQDLYAVKYIERGSVGDNTKGRMANGPCLAYYIDESDTEKHLELGLNMRLTAALMQVGEADALMSSKHINLEHYRSLKAPIEKLLYVRLIAAGWSNGNKSQESRLKFTTLYDDIYGVSHDDPDTDRKTIWKRMGAIRKGCETICSLEGWTCKEIAKSDRILHFKAPVRA